MDSRYLKNWSSVMFFSVSMRSSRSHSLLTMAHDVLLRRSISERSTAFSEDVSVAVMEKLDLRIHQTLNTLHGGAGGFGYELPLQLQRTHLQLRAQEIHGGWKTIRQAWEH